MPAARGRDLSIPWAGQERGRGPPVPLARGVHVEMRRGPVLDDRRSRVPALPAVHALEIPAAAPARLHEIALLGALGDEAHHVAGLPRLAEGATEPRRCPGAAAEVTGEPPAAVF